LYAQEVKHANGHSPWSESGKLVAAGKTWLTSYVEDSWEEDREESE